MAFNACTLIVSLVARVAAVLWSTVRTWRASPPLMDV